MENVGLVKELNEDELRAVYERARQAGAAGAFDDIEPEENIESGQFDLSGDCDENGLPFDPEGMYNSAPLEFGEMMNILWHVTNAIHYTATRYNRHSTQYSTLMKELEKHIKQLGSYCVTRAVLEKSGIAFPNMEEMPIKELYCMVSLHFRKCALAQRDLETSEHIVDLNTAGWLFRWAALAGRLHATEEKIRKIKEGKVNIDSLLAQAQVYKDEPRIRKDKSERHASPQMRARAFPILKSFANELQKVRIEDEKAAERAEKEAEREMKRRNKSLTTTSRGTYDVPPYRPFPASQMTEAGMPAGALRKMLIYDAESRGDTEAVRQIKKETEAELIERFNRIEVKDPDVRDVPSAETRKNLKKKRKRKK